LIEKTVWLKNFTPFFASNATKTDWSFELSRKDERETSKLQKQRRSFMKYFSDEYFFRKIKEFTWDRFKNSITRWYFH